MELTPETITLTEPSRIMLKIHRYNSSSTSEYSDNRKFIFIIEETDEETPPLTEGQ